MYDAKNVEDEKDDSIKCDCIEDRSYFENVRAESLGRMKSSHVPVENILE